MCDSKGLPLKTVKFNDAAVVYSERVQFLFPFDPNMEGPNDEWTVVQTAKKKGSSASVNTTDSKGSTDSQKSVSSQSQESKKSQDLLDKDDTRDKKSPENKVQPRKLNFYDNLHMDSEETETETTKKKPG